MNTAERLRDFVEVLGRAPSLGPERVRRLHRELRIAPTPVRVVHEERSFRLLHVPAAPDTTPAGPPLLLVPSLINRWYVLDLLTGHSLLEALAAAGVPSYVVAWSDAHDGQGGAGLDHVVQGLIHRAVLRACRHAGVARIGLLGQCLGGTLALAYAALHPERVDRLVTLTTPVDFSVGGKLASWARNETLDVAGLAAAFPGVVPDAVVYGAFPLLDPRALVTHRRLLYENLHVEGFRELYEAIDLWTTEHLPVASAVLRDLLQQLYRDNALWQSGGWTLGGDVARLEDVRAPLLNVVAASDDIVPAASTRPLLTRVGSTVKEEFVSPLGHVMLILGTPLRFATYQAIAGFCRRTF